MWSIIDNLYLGDRWDASDFDKLKKAGITHIVNCARELPCSFPEEFRYLELQMYDPDTSFILHIESVCKFIHEARQQGKVLVHCAAAVSRSPSTILAYLCSQGHSLDDAWALMERCVATDPHDVFWEQLSAYFDTSPEDPEAK